MMSTLKKLFNGQYPQAIFFDLDGTLVNSLGDLSAAVDAMLIELDYFKEPQSIGHDNVALWIGNGAEKLVQRALASIESITEDMVDTELLKHALNIFYKHYALCSGQFSALYPQVLNTLQALDKAELTMCVITNKPKQFTPDVLTKNSIDGFFKLVLSGDSLEQKKPHPLPILYALEKLNLDKENVVMIGDSSSDINAAKAAGIKSICVTYGYNHGSDPRELDATAHIDYFSQLVG